MILSTSKDSRGKAAISGGNVTNPPYIPRSNSANTIDHSSRRISQLGISSTIDTVAPKTDCPLDDPLLLLHTSSSSLSISGTTFRPLPPNRVDPCRICLLRRHSVLDLTATDDLTEEKVLHDQAIVTDVFSLHEWRGCDWAACIGSKQFPSPTRQDLSYVLYSLGSHDLNVEIGDGAFMSTTLSEVFVYTQSRTECPRSAIRNIVATMLKFLVAM
nr:hypothetical protein CFP56_00147 [Quercus suber]